MKCRTETIRPTYRRYILTLSAEEGKFCAYVHVRQIYSFVSLVTYRKQRMSQIYFVSCSALGASYQHGDVHES